MNERDESGRRLEASMSRVGHGSPSKPAVHAPAVSQADIVDYRIVNARYELACRSTCEMHGMQCFYEIAHPIHIHRCSMCLQDFFPGMQKSKQAISANTARKWGTGGPAFLEVEGESDFHDY